MARWLRIDADLAYNRKTERLMASLGCGRVEAVGILTVFFSLVRRERPDGVLDGITSDDVDRVSEREGVFPVLQSSGFIEEGPDGPCVHDWPDMQGAFLKDAQRHREKRDKSKNIPGPSEDSPRSILGSRARPDGTGRDETRQEEESKAQVQENVKPAPFASSLFGSVSKPPKRVGSDKSEMAAIWELVKCLPEEASRNCMALAQRLAKAGERPGVVRACVEHFLDHQDTIRSPFAYYSRGGEGLAWVKLHSRLADSDAEWAAEKKAAAEAAS
jgi:hypothetical protein